MTTAQATLEAPARDARPGGKAPYLHQIDLFRLITFACVILIHVVGATNFAQDVGANAVETPLHFTREAFFALTGFVLVFQNRRREFTAGDFWRRRLPLVATPYLAWSMFFWAYSLVTGGQQPGSLEASMRLLLADLVTGGAWYHLYFLLVTMQVYLLFPVLMKLLRATEGKHRWLLLGSGLVQVGVTLFMTYQPLGVSYETITHLYGTILPYQFYTLFGAVVAMHFETVHAWAGRHRLLLGGAFVAVLAGTEWYYLRTVHSGTFPQVASDPFQPYLIPWFLTVIAAIYAFATRWAARRREGSRGARVVSWAANRSFSIFLVHPLALALLGPVIPVVAEHFGAPWLSVVIYLGTIVLTVLIVEVLRRLPGSRALTGRPRLRRAKAAA
ncbi:acyltransferase [Amycolatopsis sp. NPDC051045]|uniref:acyltransferase n=1 Tax=Amycolatopsis sp. NPDC051045 TaxID=3156922 RepID=UPI00342054E2